AGFLSGCTATRPTKLASPHVDDRAFHWHRARGRGARPSCGLQVGAGGGMFRPPPPLRRMNCARPAPEPPAITPPPRSFWRRPPATTARKRRRLPVAFWSAHLRPDRALAAMLQTARESPALRRGRGRTLHHLPSWRDALSALSQQARLSRGSHFQYPADAFW